MDRQKKEDIYQSNEGYHNSSGKQLKSGSRIFLKNLLANEHLKSSKDNSLQLFKKNYLESKQCDEKSGYFVLFFIYKDIKKLYKILLLKAVINNIPNFIIYTFAHMHLFNLWHTRILTAVT